MPNFSTNMRDLLFIPDVLPNIFINKVVKIRKLKQNIWSLINGWKLIIENFNIKKLRNKFIEFIEISLTKVNDATNFKIWNGLGRYENPWSPL